MTGCQAHLSKALLREAVEVLGPRHKMDPNSLKGKGVDGLPAANPFY
jgi:hypothetical protein